MNRADLRMRVRIADATPMVADVISGGIAKPREMLPGEDALEWFRASCAATRLVLAGIAPAPILQELRTATGWGAAPCFYAKMPGRQDSPNPPVASPPLARSRRSPAESRRVAADDRTAKRQDGPQTTGASNDRTRPVICAPNEDATRLAYLERRPLRVLVFENRAGEWVARSKNRRMTGPPYPEATGPSPEIAVERLQRLLPDRLFHVVSRDDLNAWTRGEVSVFDFARELGLSCSRDYAADRRILYHLALDCSPEDLELDENPDDLDVATLETAEPVAAGASAETWPHRLCDLRLVRARSEDEIKGFVSHAATHGGRVPTRSQVDRLLSALARLDPSRRPPQAAKYSPWETCELCDGAGEIDGVFCDECGGTGVTHADDELLAGPNRD